MNIQDNSSKQNKDMDRKFGKYINSDSKVLEIWTWLWTFANFCVYKSVDNYTWIEIDQWMSDKLWKYFNKYDIVCDDALHFFEHSDQKYDIIFLSHVFEHFSIDDGIILAQQILKHLNPGWVWINIMPNAWCLASWVARYNDITHKVIYTDNSFNQVLLEAWFEKENINHFNVLPNNIIKKILSKLLWILLAVKYNTFELMTTIKK